MERKHRCFALSVITLLAVCLLYPDVGYCVHKTNSGASFICSGCHTIHNSEDGAYKDGTQTPNAKLLRFNSDDLCFACHAATASGGSLHASYGEAPIVKDDDLDYSATDPNNIGAGGNFSYLDATGDNASTANQGKGHNFSDTAMTPAGGSTTYTMHCATCHDPHGATTDTTTVDTYRNLKKSPNGDTTYKNITNTTEGATQNNNGVYAITANKYGVANTSGSGMSAWCEECHGTNFHGADKSGDPLRYTRHPMDIAMEDEFTDDTKIDVDPNAYELDGTITNSDSYLKLPLEDGPDSTSANTNHTGNEKKDRVFCLSCHFPHAGPFADALRWNNTGALADGVGCQQCHAK